jgi:RimJ/RimL family protein N-acetyltransferase
MQIRRLTPADASQFQTLRLAGLKDEPLSFASSYEEEMDLPASTIEHRLAIEHDRGTFGAFESKSLVGLVSLGREDMKKLRHKAFIWGMYVKPEFRGKGIARALICEAISFARSVPELKQVNLSANARNLSAIQLYQSLGFKAFGHEPGSMLINGELQDEVHMYLRLADG